MRSRTVILAELTAQECSCRQPKSMAGREVAHRLRRPRSPLVSARSYRGSTGILGASPSEPLSASQLGHRLEVFGRTHSEGDLATRISRNASCVPHSARRATETHRTF